MADARGKAGRLRELAWLFLRLGTTAFGGPAAHVAMMEDEVVRRRGWLGREEFLAGACFILPAAAMVWALAWFYVQYGHRPGAEALLEGVKPVVVAVVLQALWGLAGSALKNRGLIAAAVAAVVAVLIGVHELAVLFGTGIVVAAVRATRAERHLAAALEPLPLLGLAAAAPAAAVVTPSSLFLVFLKIGSVLFGSGYVLLAFLRAELVQRLGWLTEAQLLDAVAVGQVTPGPLFTTATFVGFVLGGHAGALAATAGIFLPAFFFVAASAPLVPRMRRSATFGAFLDGVNVASLALMAVVTWQLARGAVHDVLTAALAVAAGVLLLRYRVNSSWLVLGGALLGWLARSLR